MCSVGKPGPVINSRLHSSSLHKQNCETRLEVFSGVQCSCERFGDGEGCLSLRGLPKWGGHTKWITSREKGYQRDTPTSQSPKENWLKPWAFRYFHRAQLRRRNALHWDSQKFSSRAACKTSLRHGKGEWLCVDTLDTVDCNQDSASFQHPKQEGCCSGEGR